MEDKFKIVATVGNSEAGLDAVSMLSSIVFYAWAHGGPRTDQATTGNGQRPMNVKFSFRGKYGVEKEQP